VTKIYDADGAQIHMVVVGPMDNDVYVLRCTETGDAVLLDAANEHERLLDLCKDLGVRKVLETHGHWDHIQAVPQLRDAGYSVGVTAEDAGMLPSYDEVIEDDSEIEVGRLKLHTIHTPGHTRGSMCFKLEGHPVLFSGDQVRGRRLPDDHPVDRGPPLQAAGRHDRPARPRRQDDDRERASAPPGVDRPGLVIALG
jgi:glyoxylase-like metal-dependent hydrolase (beta-lactamase superfamily II)